MLLTKDLGDPIGGCAVPCLFNGTEYVAVAGGMNNPIVQRKSGPAWVAILALPQRNK